MVGFSWKALVFHANQSRARGTSPKLRVLNVTDPWNSACKRRGWAVGLRGKLEELGWRVDTEASEDLSLRLGQRAE